MIHFIGIYAPATSGYRGFIPAEIRYTFTATRRGIRTPFI